MAQTVKNLPTVQETWVPFQGWEDTLEKVMDSFSRNSQEYSSILAWRIPMDRGTWWATVHGVEKSQTQLSD